MIEKCHLQRALVVVWLIAGCSGLNGCGTPAESQARLTVVPTPVGIYSAVTWLDDWLILQMSPLNMQTAFDFTVWQLRPDGRDATQMHFPERPGCRHQVVRAPSRLPDGGLGYLVDCQPPEMLFGQLYMMAYDTHTQQVSALMNGPLLSGSIGTGGYSWNPEMTRGITSDGDGPQLSEQLYWFTPTDTQKFHVGFPQAFAAAWAPDGVHIAFLGAPEQGRTGVARADSVFNLYLMQPDGTHIQALIEGFRYSTSLAWSPDSRWIAFPATFGTFTQGLWLIEVATGRCRLITSGDFVAPTWAPDGKQLAAIQYAKESPNKQQHLVIIDLNPLLQTSSSARDR